MKQLSSQILWYLLIPQRCIICRFNALAFLFVQILFRSQQKSFQLQSRILFQKKVWLCVHVFLLKKGKNWNRNKNLSNVLCINWVRIVWEKLRIYLWEMSVMTSTVIDGKFHFISQISTNIAWFTSNKIF